MRTIETRRFDVVFYQPYVSSIYAPAENVPPGGAETQISLVARELAAHGIRVAIIVYDVRNLPNHVDGIQLIVRPPKDRRSNWRLVGKILEIWVLWRSIRTLNTSVIVQRTSSAETGLVALMAKLRGKRFVWSSASDVDFEYRRVDPKRRNEILFELGVRLADRIVVQTVEQQRLCQAKFSRAPIVASSIGQPAPQRTTVPTSFLWIGRLVDYKRPFAFIDLARALPSARFRMIGVPSVNSPDVAEAVRLGSEDIDNLDLLEPRPRHELMAEIDSAVAIVNTAEHEGMPNIFLEGWARGVPALAFGQDPNGVIARHGLGECADGSFDQFVSLASSMWKEREDQAEVAQRCREYMIAEHSPDAVVERWIEALDFG